MHFDNKLRLLEDVDATNLTESSFRSGDVIPTFYMALIDKYGQIVETDSSSKLTMTVE